MSDPFGNHIVGFPTRRLIFYIAENELAGVNSLTGVIATALCALNKRNLQMEAAAAGILLLFVPKHCNVGAKKKCCF